MSTPVESPSFDEVMALDSSLAWAFEASNQDIVSCNDALKAYRNHLAALPDQVKRHMKPFGHLDATIVARTATLLAELETRNEAKIHEIEAHLLVVTERHHRLADATEAAWSARGHSIEAMVAWYYTWYNHSCLETTTLESKALEYVYFYEELSPVDVETIGFFGTPYDAVTKSGVKATTGNHDLNIGKVTVQFNGKLHGRNQEITEDEWKDLWYHHGVRQRAFWRRTFNESSTLNVDYMGDTLEQHKKSMQYTVGSFYPNGQTHDIVSVDETGRIMLLSSQLSTGEKHGFFYDITNKSRSGVYENDVLVTPLSELRAQVSETVVNKTAENNGIDLPRCLTPRLQAEDDSSDDDLPDLEEASA